MGKYGKIWEKYGKDMYPLVNCYITMENFSIFHGEIQYFNGIVLTI